MYFPASIHHLTYFFSSLNFIVCQHQEVCCFCWKVMTMNSAGRTRATFTVTLINPSRMSSEVMVAPRPTSTLNASSRVAPTSAPAFHWLVRKLEIMFFSVSHVEALLGANT